MSEILSAAKELFDDQLNRDTKIVMERMIDIMSIQLKHYGPGAHPSGSPQSVHGGTGVPLGQGNVVNSVDELVTKDGKWAYLILPENKLIDASVSEHYQSLEDYLSDKPVYTKNLLNKYMKKSGIPDRIFEQLSQHLLHMEALLSAGGVRVSRYYKSLYIHTNSIDTKTLRQLHKYIDRNLLGVQGVNDLLWDSRTGSETMKITMSEFLSAGSVYNGMLRDKELGTIQYKGGEGSGFHGHAGRPGLVGGSTSDNVKPAWIRKYNAIARERVTGSTITDDMKLFDTIAPGVKALGYGLCGLHTLEGCERDPSLDIAIGWVFTDDDIEKINNFDKKEYWSMGTIGLQHIWNVDTEGRIVDRSFGSKGARDYTYLGKILPKSMKFSTDSELIWHLYHALDNRLDTDISNEDLDAKYQDWLSHKQVGTLRLKCKE